SALSQLAICTLIVVLGTNSRTEAAPACNYSEEVSSVPGKTVLHLPGQEVPAQILFYISIKEQRGELVKLDVRNSVNINSLKPIMLALMQQFVALPGSNCNNRYSSSGYFLNGTGRNELVGGFTVSYSKWACASADVPCPTWREPFRFCRQDATTK